MRLQYDQMLNLNGAQFPQKLSKKSPQHVLSNKVMFSKSPQKAVNILATFTENLASRTFKRRQSGRTE